MRVAGRRKAYGVSPFTAVVVELHPSGVVYRRNSTLTARTARRTPIQLFSGTSTQQWGRLSRLSEQEEFGSVRRYLPVGPLTT